MCIPALHVAHSSFKSNGDGPVSARTRSKNPGHHQQVGSLVIGVGSALRPTNLHDAPVAQHTLFPTSHQCFLLLVLTTLGVWFFTLPATCQTAVNLFFMVLDWTNFPSPLEPNSYGSLRSFSSMPSRFPSLAKITARRKFATETTTPPDVHFLTIFGGFGTTCGYVVRILGISPLKRSSNPYKHAMLAFIEFLTIFDCATRRTIQHGSPDATFLFTLHSTHLVF